MLHYSAIYCEEYQTEQDGIDGEGSMHDRKHKYVVTYVTT